MITDQLREKVFDCLKQPLPQGLEVVEQSIPVPFFGNIETAHFATIGLNPSDNEFLGGKKGTKYLLQGAKKRFADRNILGIQDNASLTPAQTLKAYESLIKYFAPTNNIYKTWFNPLDKFAGVLFGGASYYDGTMVNLDICPWATKKKWSDLCCNTKSCALNNYDLVKDFLISQPKSFDFVYLNGVSVKTQIEKILGIKIPAIQTQTVNNRSYSVYKYTLSNGCILIGTSLYLQNDHLTTNQHEQVLTVLKTHLYDAR